MHKIVTIVFIVMLTVVGANAFAYQFWGVNVGTAAYDSSTQLTFDGLSGSGIQYAVGGWKYTRVDGQWFGAFAAPIPGEGWLASRRSDAQGIFFKSDGANACFTVVTTASQNGQLATELGYDRRLFGGGDLKIDVGGHTYGVGMRNSNLLWAENPSATQPQYQIYGADGNIISMNSRDAGTLGSVVQDPDWARAGNQSLPADSDYRFAFFVNGTGSVVGWAGVSFADTGIFMNGAHVYSYEVTVPWTTLGITDGQSFSASWRPDCGNDLISSDFNRNALSSPSPSRPLSSRLPEGLLDWRSRSAANLGGNTEHLLYRRGWKSAKQDGRTSMPGHLAPSIG